MFSYPIISVVGIAKGAKIEGTIENLNVSAVSIQYTPKSKNIIKDISYWNDKLKGKKDLVLINDKLEEDEYKALSEVLKTNTNVINLNFCSKDPNHPKYIFEALKYNTSVKLLHLGGNYIGDEGCKYISEVLKVNNSLSELYIMFNNVGDKGCEYLYEALKVNTTLKILNLSNNNIGEYGIKLLNRSLFESGLQELIF